MAVIIDVSGWYDSPRKSKPFYVSLTAPLSGFIFPTEIA